VCSVMEQISGRIGFDRQVPGRRRSLCAAPFEWCISVDTQLHEARQPADLSSSRFETAGTHLFIWVAPGERHVSRKVSHRRFVSALTKRRVGDGRGNREIDGAHRPSGSVRER